MQKAIDAPLLYARDLSVGYTSHILFDKIHVSLPPGTLTCFMGPNGIGKSTLIRTLAGLQRPLSGEVSSGSKKNIAVVLTDKITASHMTVYDLVSYGRYPHIDWEISFTSVDRDAIDQSIREVRIQSLVNKKLEELSDGQLQLAMIARALAQETPVLLLDEPTAHLDLNNRVEIMKLLLTLARNKNKGIVVATHELDLALQMADYVWLATTDKKIASGIPEDLVLDGSFDQVFQFKGFDLKTGKIQHESFQQKTIDLRGDGYELLWTKNALERRGFSISSGGELTISIYSHEGRTVWKINDRSVFSIGELLDFLTR